MAEMWAVTVQSAHLPFSDRFYKQKDHWLTKRNGIEASLSQPVECCSRIKLNSSFLAFGEHRCRRFHFVNSFQKSHLERLVLVFFVTDFWRFKLVMSWYNIFNPANYLVVNKIKSNLHRVPNCITQLRSFPFFQRQITHIRVMKYDIVLNILFLLLISIYQTSG